MNLYNIRNLNDSIIKPGASINILSDALMELSNHEQFQTMEQIMPYDLIHISLKDGLKIQQAPNLIHQLNLNTGCLILIEKDSLISFEYEDKTYYIKKFKGQLHLSTNLEELNKLTQKEDISHLSTEEKQAYEWLESKNTGLSSMAMCNHFFPTLNHYKLIDLRNDNYDGVKSYPHDNADFSRCLNFLKNVDIDQNKFQTLKTLSPIWNKLVNNWESITTLINEGKSQDAYYAIKECSKQNKPKV